MVLRAANVFCQERTRLDLRVETRAKQKLPAPRRSMRFNGPRVKLSRQLGVAITPKAQRIIEKSPTNNRNARSERRLSDYGVQLLEKQRLRCQYNVSETQMRRYFARAQRQQGRTGERLIQMLECRVDAV